MFSVSEFLDMELECSSDCVWSEAAPRQHCIVCGRARPAGSAGAGVSRTEFIEEMMKGPIERGVNRVGR